MCGQVTGQITCLHHQTVFIFKCLQIANGNQIILIVNVKQADIVTWIEERDWMFNQNAQIYRIDLNVPLMDSLTTSSKSRSTTSKWYNLSPLIFVVAMVISLWARLKAGVTSFTSLTNFWVNLCARRQVRLSLNVDSVQSWRQEI